MEVGQKIDKTIYFIFCQKGGANDIYKLEENENVKNIKILKQDNYLQNPYLLYSFAISSMNKEKNVTLFLTKSEEKYIATLKSFKEYSEIFLYKVDFKPFNENINNMNQIILPYKEQFIIFKKNIVGKNNDLLKYLILSSLDFIQNCSLINPKEDLASQIKFEFDYFLYLFISSLFLNNYNPDENILNSFLKEFNTDLIEIQNSFNRSTSNINIILEISDTATLELLNDYNLSFVLFEPILKMNELNNNKFIVLLAYYYFIYQPKLFINFISEKNIRSKEVNEILIKYRKIFKDFSTEIMDFTIFDEAENLSEIQNVFLLMPNLVEITIALSEEKFYSKVDCLSRIETKICNLYRFIKPKKEDNIELLKKNIEKMTKMAKELDNYMIFSLTKDFFICYCELFFDENLKNLELLIDIYNLYKAMPVNIEENLEQEIYSYYYDTGLNLIKKGKLINMDFISFVTKINSISKKIELPDEIYNSIVISNDISFINNFLNDELNIGDNFIKFVKGFFNNFKTIKDFAILEKWEKNQCKNEEVFYICFETLKKLWIKEDKNKFSQDLCSFIAEIFIIMSKKNSNFIIELTELEKELNNPPKFLGIFSLLLKKKDINSEALIEHIYNYINSNIKEGEPLSIYYKLLTISPDNRKNFLIQNLTISYAIKPEDFINYPDVMEERILLFTKLFNEKYFSLDDFELEDKEYFQESIKAKDKIDTLKYKDAIKMCKNIYSFQTLFLFFLPRRINGDNDFLIDILLVNFYENCNKCKEKYNSLKLVLNYWKHFFSYTRRVEINELVNFLEILENTPLIEFQKLETNIDSFLFYVNEAKEKDKLYNSFFFMGLYNDKSIYFEDNEELEKFNYTLLRFNELKSLGINSNINKLPSDLIQKLTELVYKNNDRLDDELKFIKEYFEFDNNSNNYKYDLNKIKRDFNNKVNEYKKRNNLEDYEIEFDDDFSLMKYNNSDLMMSKNNSSISKMNKNITTKTDGNNDDDEFNLFTNDGDNEEFSLFCGKDDSQKIENVNNIINEKQVENNNMIPESEKIILLKDLNRMSYDYYYIYKIASNSDDAYEDNILFLQKFNNFFWETFKNIHKYEILSEKEFYEDILLAMKKIFLTFVGTNFFKKDNNDDKEIYLIYELYEILEIYKKYHLIKKYQINNIIEKILECKENENEENINTGNIEHLFGELEENLKGKNFFNLPIKILLIEEKIKSDEQFNFKIIDYILRKDNKHLLNYSIPLFDKIFKEEIISKIKLDEENNDITQFDNYSLNQIEKELKNEKDLEEILLFYFESKLFKIIFGKNKNNLSVKNIYKNESIKNFLRQCLNLLEKESRNELHQNNKKISILFCIAFTKIFLSNYINTLHKKSQEIGDVNDINNRIVKGYGNSLFRTSLKLYILKLFYNIFGNYNDFTQFNYNKYQIDYFDNEDILKLKEKNEFNLSINKNQKKYGFDYLFITLNQNDIEEYINIEKNLNDLSLNDSNRIDSNNLISIINNSKNLDNFICALINIYLSNYQNSNFFNSEDFKAISNWIIDNLNSNNFNKINDTAKNILFLLIDKKKYDNKILKIDENITYGVLTYNQLLTLSFSLRYVLNTLFYSNQNNLFFQLVIEGKRVINNNDSFFFYYNKDFNSYNNRAINHLTFTFIRFIIISHLYFSYLLNNITLDDINMILLNNENNLRVLELLEHEFDLIKKIIGLKGIRNIIIFMNYVFKDIKSIITGTGSISDENSIKNLELNIESEISTYLDNYDNYIDNYNNLVQKINNSDEKNEFKKIIYEDKQFYNTNNIDNKYPFITYFTITNFSSINDFKNQFNYLINDKYNYPMINCILNNSEIMKITSNLPFINSFINEIYNELVLKIKKEDIDKKINNFVGENIINQIEKFNSKINEINKLNSFSNNKLNEISINSKISEIININENPINKYFNNIIKIYNEFLINTKIYKDNKNLLESIIIQNASKNDYYILNNENDGNNNDNYNNDIYITPNEKLEEIVSLYSKRNRYSNNMINLDNGSKINYDFNQIEIMLQKEYLYGKKPFQETQKTFIFSNEVYSNERYDIITNLKNKYPQIDIKEEIVLKGIESFINNEDKNNDIFKEIYINLQYLIIYLMIYDKNNFDCEKISLEYIAKIIQKSNYKINELLMQFLNQYNDGIHLNNLLFLYEKIELKCFEFLTPELSNEIKYNDLKDENISNIIDYFKNDKLLLNEEILLNSIKKYILRYYIGNNQNKNELYKNDQLDKILNKEDIWEDKIYKDEKFKEESKELLQINNEQNLLMNYFFSKLFKIKKERKIEKEIKNEIIEEKKVEPQRKKRNRPRIKF